ncbi:MAG: hypothetical protein ACEPOW_03590 [Bacteroidales bacterium]
MKIQNLFTKKLAFLMLILMVFSCSSETEDAERPNDPRDRFVGEWSVLEVPASRLNYQVIITKDPNNSSQILLQNFANSNDKVKALVVSNTATLLEQTFGDGWLLQSGSGTIESDGNIDFSFNIVISEESKKYSAIFSKN